MIGQRIREFSDPITFASGDYGFWSAAGYWIARTPNGEFANLGAHEIVEHDDGTITVSPSIKVSTSRDGGRTHIELWHGFLERGVWRSC